MDLLNARRGRRSAAAGVVCAVALLAAGCGSGSAAPFTPSELDGWMDRTAAETESTSAVYAYIRVYDDEWRERATERLTTQQETVAECMADAEFEFVPYVADAGGVAGLADDPWGGLTHRQYVERWGYGVSTTRDAAGQVVPDAPGFGGREDPNEAVIAALSSDERTAYQVALYGDLVTAEYEPDADGNVAGVDAGGCTGEGLDAVGGVTGMRGTDDADWQEFTALYADVGTQVDGSDDMADAAGRYRSCMDDAGYPEVDGVDDGVKAIRRRIDAAAASLRERESFSSDTNADTAPADERQPVAADDIDQIRRFEIDLATDELPCLADYRLSDERVRGDVEQSFIDDHRALLDRIRSAN